MDSESSYITKNKLLKEISDIGCLDYLVLSSLEFAEKVHKDEFRRDENISALEAHIYPTIHLLIEHYKAY